MEFNWTTIGILVVVWLVGYLLGLLESAIKSDMKKGKEEEPEASDDEGVEEEAHEAKERVVEPEILTIFERISGALKLRLDGEIVEYSSDLTPEQRERLLKVVISLRPWLDGPKQPAQTAPIAADVAAPTIPTSSAKTPTPSPPLVKIKEEIEADIAKRSYSNLSMVEQIDRILQKKLKDGPLDKRGIRMRSSLSGGLLITVGLAEYEWIEDIPEQDIQDIIREATAEWEEKATVS